MSCVSNETALYAENESFSAYLYIIFSASISKGNGFLANSPCLSFPDITTLYRDKLKTCFMKLLNEPSPFTKQAQ